MKQVQTLFAMKQTMDGKVSADIVILEFVLQIQEISVSILNQQQQLPPLFRVAALKLEQGLSMTVSELISRTALSDLFVEFTFQESISKRLISAKRSDGISENDRVITVKYTSVSSLSPDFESKHACTLSRFVLC